MSFVPERLEVTLPESAYVGQTVVYRIELVRPEDVSVRLPAKLDVSPFSLNGVAQRQEKLGPGRVREVLELELGIYTLDDAEVPGFDLVVVTPDGTVDLAIPARALQVQSLVAEEGETPREMAPPDTVWLPDYAVLKAAGVALAVLFVILLLFRLVSRLRSRPKRAAPAPPPPRPRPAHEVALEALEALRAEELVAKGERKRFFFGLSEIIREYVGARFGFESLELTTTELLARLRDRPAPGLDLARFGAWCGQCDLVKFARYVPNDVECGEALTFAFGLVEKTRQRPSQAAAPERAEPSAAGAGS